MKSKWLPILAAAALLPPSAYADVTYQETTKITGGSLTKMLKLASAFSSQARQAERRDGDHDRSARQSHGPIQSALYRDHRSRPAIDHIH